MEILNSDWLIHMLKKSCKSPEGRLLNLFEILDDWLDAPKVESNINQTTQPQHAHLLQDFLALEAAKAGAELPEMLASQLYFMAVAAAQEKLAGNNTESFLHAKHAAKALVSAQTHKTFHLSRKTIYASAASFALVSIITGSMVFSAFQSSAEQNIHTAKNDYPTTNHNVILASKKVNPDHRAASPTQTAALFARIEQMRQGNCQLIEALQLPEAYKKIYFDNIIMGQISTDREEQRVVNELLQMVRCNYTPMLMANSKG
jgi:hypothetical protein